VNILIAPDGSEMISPYKDNGVCKYFIGLDTAKQYEYARIRKEESNLVMARLGKMSKVIETAHLFAAADIDVAELVNMLVKSMIQTAKELSEEGVEKESLVSASQVKGDA